MAEDELTTRPVADDESSTSEWRLAGTRSTSRRTFLATGAAISAATLGGCLGGSVSEGSETTTSGDPETPWTTEELADKVEDGTELTIYAGAGSPSTWRSLINVINDEFGVDMTVSVVDAGGSQISQRFIQERQADEDTADLLTAATDLRNQIYKEGESKAKEYFEWDIDKKFWFSDELEDHFSLPWGASFYNGGASLAMPINTEIFEKKGLDVPANYNDLFDDQYEGLPMGVLTDPVADQLGWIIGYHAEQKGMEPMEWIESLMDHFDVSGYAHHSNGGRAVAEGKEALMIYNFPWTIAELVQDPEFPLDPNFPEPTKWATSEGLTYINKNAPNPWAARLVLSASLEKPVQRKLVNEVPEITIARTDVDLSDVEMSSYARRRLNTELDPVDFWENQEYTEIGLEAVKSEAYEV